MLKNVCFVMATVASLGVCPIGFGFEYTWQEVASRLSDAEGAEQQSTSDRATLSTGIVNASAALNGANGIKARRDVIWGFLNETQQNLIQGLIADMTTSIDNANGFLVVADGQHGNVNTVNTGSWHLNRDPGGAKSEYLFWEQNVYIDPGSCYVDANAAASSFDYSIGQCVCGTEELSGYTYSFWTEWSEADDYLNTWGG